MRMLKGLALLMMLLFFQSSSWCQPHQSANHESAFYAINDFLSAKKIDAHVHIRTGDTAFSHQARVDNFKLITIVVDESPGIRLQQKYAVKQMQLFPGLIDFATTFPVKHLNNPHWQEQTIEGLKKIFFQRRHSGKNL